MRVYSQLSLFDLTPREREELIEILEFDYEAFPPPKPCTRYTTEVRRWYDRSARIESYIDRNFTIKK